MAGVKQRGKGSSSETDTPEVSWDIPVPPLHVDPAALRALDFKEDAVREDIVHPLLLGMGYASSGSNRIIRSKPLTHPFVVIGTTKRPITLIPDYLLSVDNRYRWVLDAKAPRESVTSNENVEQAYSYAIHPEIRTRHFALCNGREFALYEIEDRTPLLHFEMTELAEFWKPLTDFLHPDAFRRIATRPVPLAPPPLDYLAIKPPKEIISFQKQSVKRYHGVHGYFTRQVWSVVQKYISTFTQPGDVVLDPFGGSGVTYIESLILGRKAIQLDINPLCKFIVETLVEPIDSEVLTNDFRSVEHAFKQRRPRNDLEAEALLKIVEYPKGVRLPKTSDVDTVDQLFSRMQLAELALLRDIISKVRSETSRAHLMLMFSGLLNKINLTYHASAGRSEGRGDSAVFRYYRYRIAHDSPRLDVAAVFRLRLKKLLAAKEELRSQLTKVRGANPVMQGSATDLSMIESESVDYIYTDPPYGSKIPYLDLSTMWNSWLGFEVGPEDFAQEAIEGGELRKTKSEYASLLSDSIREMYRVLKFNRWMSFVFAHKGPAYWHLIVETAEKVGFEYAGVTRQNNGQTSFKKRQNPFTVLSGQLIINFRKVKNPKSIMAVKLGMDIADIIEETIEGTIAANQGATLEQINDGLVIRGLELGFLHILSQQYNDLTPLLRQKFQYEDIDSKYYIKKNTKFKTHVDVRLRVRYYLLSYMRRLEHQGIHPTFDDIVLSIIPLLKNGITPENQTVLSVLEVLAERDDSGRWRLKSDGQVSFDF